LDPQKRYSYKVFVYVKSGYMTASKVDTVTTKDGLPMKVEVAVGSGSLTDTSIALEWTQNHDSDFKQYIVCFDTISEVDTFKTIPRILPNMVARTFSGDTTASITALKPEKDYWFAVYVQDQDGLLAVSNKLKATTDSTQTVQGR
jgi:phosphodiesterase/alkaline phosphatase D-like protein